MKYQTENSIIVEIMRYRDLEVRMKKKISALLVMLLACGIFGGCGATKDADTQGQPIIEHYRSKGLVHDIQGNQDINDVFSAIEKVLTNLK